VGWADKKYKGLVQGASAAFGNAATRIEAFVAAGGAYVSGSYADIDGLFSEQAGELDPKRREATLHRIQQLMHDKAMVAPIWLNAGLNGVGPRIEESGVSDNYDAVNFGMLSPSFTSSNVTFTGIPMVTFAGSTPTMLLMACTPSSSSIHAST
jgi:ABC-type transport system substrate-binding protein